MVFMQYVGYHSDMVMNINRLERTKIWPLR